MRNLIYKIKILNKDSKVIYQCKILSAKAKGYSDEFMLSKGLERLSKRVEMIRVLESNL